LQEAVTEPYQQEYEAFHLEEEVVPAVLSTCPVSAFEPEISPEMRVWCSVLIVAVSDLGKKSYRAAALAWIEDSENSDIGSFNFCCELFHLSPDRIRRYLLNEYKPRWLSVRKASR
jgi:hypothetical protein